MAPVSSSPVGAAAASAAPTAAMRRAAQAFEAQAFEAQAFEAQVLSQLLAPAFATVDMGRSAFGGGAAEEQWRPMLLDAMAGAAARSGRGGIGVAEAVLREMLRRQGNAAAPGGGGEDDAR
jgi:peptidoglycan hydrolase FlgJ